MAANPPLVVGRHGELAPAPFAGEFFVLGRKGVEIQVDCVRTKNGKWKADGSLYLSHVRFVFVANKPDVSGLQSFDLPLAYISNEKFNQPIFGCNNLSFRCFPVGEAGGPSGSLPPHDLKLYLKEGGCGTLLPFFFRLMEQARAQQMNQPTQPAQSYPSSFAPPSAKPNFQKMVETAYIDPNDPTTVYVSQPVGQEQVMKSDDMPYEPTGLKP